MINTIKKNAIFGISWTTAEYIFISVVQVIQLSILARILAPADFGIFAIGTFFSTLGNTVFALGLGPALVQKEGEISDYLDTAWSANLFMSALATLFLGLLVPLVIFFYFDESQALYPSLVLLSVVIISGFNNIGLVIFLKKIEMKLIFYYHVIPKIIGVAIAIVFSLILRNYWGLVIGVVSESFSRMILSYILMPRKPKFIIDKLKLKELYSFGGWLQLKNIVGWAANNIDVAIVGAMLNVSLLGFYNRAVSLARLPQAQIGKIINVVSFPLYSAIKSDEKKLQGAVKANNDFVLMIIFPILIIVLLFGESVVRLILGEDWLYLTSAFKLLIMAITIQAYFISFTPLLRALGYPKYELFYQILKIFVMVILLYPLTKYYGINGAGLAILFSTIISAPYMFYKIQRIFPFQIKDLSTSFFVSIPSFGIMFMLKEFVIKSQIDNLMFIFISISVVLIHFTLLYGFLLFFKIGPLMSVQKAFRIINK